MTERETETMTDRFKGKEREGWGERKKRGGRGEKEERGERANGEGRGRERRRSCETYSLSLFTLSSAHAAHIQHPRDNTWRFSLLIS